MTKKKQADQVRLNFSHIFRYESSKLHGSGKIIFCVTLFSQFISFLFFYLVGKLEVEDKLLSEFQSILALSTTVTMCVVCLVGAIFLRKNIVQQYIGAHRIRTFLYPIKRSRLFIIKTLAFMNKLLVPFFVGNLLLFALEVLFSYFFRLKDSNGENQILNGMGICIIYTLFVFSISLCSEIIAIWRQSEITVIITTVVSILIISNLSALGTINYLWITFIFSSLLAFLQIYWLGILSEKIDKADAY